MLDKYKEAHASERVIHSQFHHWSARVEWTGPCKAQYGRRSPHKRSCINWPLVARSRDGSGRPNHHKKETKIVDAWEILLKKVKIVEHN
jgi:hypothetical protein